jgi:hypothetical protein
MGESPDSVSLTADESEPSDEVLAELARRADAFVYYGDRRALWPTLELHAIQAAADAIGERVAMILQGSHASLAEGDRYGADAVGVAGMLTGVGPLLGYWTQSGQLHASDSVRPVLERHLRHARARRSRIDAVMRPLLAQLAARGVTPAVMKGFHTAHAYFPDPGTRPFGDVDLIVRRDEITTVESVLRERGFRAGSGVADPYKLDWIPPGEDGRIRSFELWHAKNKWKLELHGGLTFDQLTAYDIQLDRHAAMDGTWDAVGTPLRVASEPLLIAMLAVHASGELYASRLLRLVELTLVVRKDEAAGVLDWRAVEELLDQAGALRFAYPALALVERLVPGTIDEHVVASARRASSRRARKLVDAFTPTSPIIQTRVSLAERLMWATTARQIAARLWLMIVPVQGVGQPGMLRIYHSRLRRLATVRWRAGRVPDDARPRG